MKARSLARSMSLAGLASLGVFCGGGDEATYTHAGDAAFVTATTGSWVATTRAGTVVTLAICEDPSRVMCNEPSIGTSDCDEQCHVVRSGDRGTEESLATTQRGCSCAGAHAELGVRVVVTAAGGATVLGGVIDVSPDDGGGAYGSSRRLFASRAGETSGQAELTGYLREDTFVLEIRDPAVPAPAPGADAGGGFVSGDTLLFRRDPAMAAARCDAP